ncbi:hypothetical protein GC194_05615 [bacterium]|nr:hypothetical protein [bacterium]
MKFKVLVICILFLGFWQKSEAQESYKLYMSFCTNYSSFLLANKVGYNISGVKIIKPLDFQYYISERSALTFGVADFTYNMDWKKIINLFQLDDGDIEFISARDKQSRLILNVGYHFDLLKDSLSKLFAAVEFGGTPSIYSTTNFTRRNYIISSPGNTKIDTYNGQIASPGFTTLYTFSTGLQFDQIKKVPVYIRIQSNFTYMHLTAINCIEDRKVSENFSDEVHNEIKYMPKGQLFVGFYVSLGYKIGKRK